MRTICFLFFLFLNFAASSQYQYLGKKQLFNSDITDLTISPDGIFLVATSPSNVVRVFNAENLEPYEFLDAHTDEVYAAAFSPDGKYLATAGLDNFIFIWKTSDWSILHRIITGQEYITSLAFNYNSSLLASAAASGMKVFDRHENWRAKQELSVSEKCWSVAFSADGQHLAAGIENTLRLWRSKDWTKSDILIGPSLPVYSISFSPDNKYVTAGGEDSTVYILQLKPDIDYFDIKAHDERIQKLIFSPDSKRLITGGSDKKINSWEIGTWKKQETIELDHSVADIELFPKQDKLVVATTGGWLHGYGRQQQVQAYKKTIISKPLQPTVHTGTIRQANERRIALLIGNADYSENSRLDNPVKDVDSLSKAFVNLGFEVMSYKNLDLPQMNRALNTFGKRLERSKQMREYTVALFYYSGHGVQVKGNSYLIPLKDNIQGEEDVSFEAFNLKRLYAKLDRIQSDINVVIVDACRNNPFDARFTEGQRLLFPNTQQGLGMPSEQPDNILIAYSTSPSQVAMDGKGDNSPYVTELLKFLPQPLKVEELFKTVRRGVRKATEGKQMPWTASTLINDFSFAK